MSDSSSTSVKNPDHGGVLRAAGAMGAATFLSRILGLVREQVFAMLFGAGNATDAFNIAFRIPNLLRDLFAEGAMSAALVPTFTRAREERGDVGAWRLAGLVFRVLFVVVGVIAVIGMFFAPQLVNLYASSFKAIPGKYELTVRMTRIMFPFFPLVALAAAYMGILNACGKFFVPALSSALFNLVSIVSGVILALTLPRFGIEPIQGMAIGVVLGGLVQAFCQLPLLKVVGYQWHQKLPEEPLWHQDPALKRMLFLMGPATIGLAATQINILVNSMLATSQGAGAVSYLNYAFRLLQFPIGIFGVSLAAATLPLVSKQWVKKDGQAVAETIARSLKHVLAVNLPAAAGLAFLGVPIIRLLFQHGRFTSVDTEATAAALAAYSLGLGAYSAVKVLVPACYGMGNTRIPVISSALAVACTITFNLIMIRPFGFVGLALGTSCAAIINALFLLFSIQKLLIPTGFGLPWRPLLGSFAKNVLISLAMGGVCWASSNWLNVAVPDVTLGRYLGGFGILALRLSKLFLLMSEGVLVLIALARLVGLDETTEVVNLFAKKLKKKLRPSEN